jgi:hypothetical protein
LRGRPTIDEQVREENIMYNVDKGTHIMSMQTPVRFVDNIPWSLI